MEYERIYRIGEKLVSLDKTERLVERIFKLRSQGVSQQETARRLSLDRSFVSRLESAGEIRKGKRVAVIGFPISNVEELKNICQSLGLDFFMLLNNQERWALMQEKQALDFLNYMLELLSRLREFDTLVLLTSKRWYRLAEGLLDLQIIHITLGETPLREDLHVDPARFAQVMEQVVKSGAKGAG